MNIAEQLAFIQQRLAALEVLMTNHITTVYTRLDTFEAKLSATSANSLGWNAKTITAVIVSIAALLGYKLV